MPKSISRVTRSKADARKNYNRLSRWYDILAGSTEEKYRQMGIQILDAQAGERILEIGFGTGQVLIALARAVSLNGFVYGVDISDGMLSVAQQKTLKAGVTDCVQFAIADAAKIPFCEGYFDSIFMSFTLELIDTPEIPKVLHQCRRILKPNGRLAIVTMYKSEKPGFAERIYEWFHARMPVLVDCRPIDAQVSLSQAGFSIEQVTYESMWGLPVEIILARK